MTPSLRASSAHVFVADLEVPMLESDDDHHLRRVLRLRNGEPVSCSDGDGRWRMCQWDDGLRPMGPIERIERPGPALAVAVAPVKGDRTDLVVEKLVEIGIDKVLVLAATKRSVVRWSADKSTTVMERYRRIARSAAMQSRRVHAPVIEGPIELASLLRDSSGHRLGLAEPGGSMRCDEVEMLVIGPEGGWDPDELAMAPGLVDLGASILRAETAAIVGASVMVAHRRR